MSFNSPLFSYEGGQEKVMYVTVDKTTDSTEQYLNWFGSNKAKTHVSRPTSSF